MAKITDVFMHWNASMCQGKSIYTSYFKVFELIKFLQRPNKNYDRNNMPRECHQYKDNVKQKLKKVF